MALKVKSSSRVHPHKAEVLKEITKEPTVMVTVLVPESLRLKCKLKALNNKTTISTLVLNFLKGYVDN